MREPSDTQDDPTEGERAGKMNRRSFIGSAVGVVGALATSQVASAQTADRSYETITVPEGDRYSTRIGDGETFENKLIDISAPGATFRIEAYGSNWTIRNVGIKGVWDQRSDGHQQGISCRVDSGTGRIDNVYFADGCPDDVFPGVTGIYVQRSHAGTLQVNNVNIQDVPNNAIYASNFGSSSGGGGSIEITNSFAANCLSSHFRIAGDGSRVDNCVAVGGDRGVWAKYGEMEVSRCDLTGAATNRADGDLVCGTNTSSTNAVVDVADSYFQSCAPGDQGVNYPGEINGTSLSQPRRTDPSEVDGVPLTAEEAAKGNSDGSTERGDSTQPIDSGQLLEIETADGAPLVEYEFTVDGNVARRDRAEVTDVIDASDGSTTVSGRAGDGYGDSFAIDGELTDWSASVDPRYYTLRLGDEELDPAQFQSGRTLTIEMAEDAPRIDYEFTVDGSVSKGDLAERNDTVTSDDDTTTVSGQGSGGWSDDFVVDGDLTDWSATADARYYTLTLDGEELDPAQFQSGETLTIEMTDDAPRIDYEFVVDGDVSRGDMAEPNDVIATSDGTTTVSGQGSGGWSDDFVVDGELTDWSASVDAQYYTLTLGSEEIDPAQFDTSRTLTVEMADDAPRIDYEFTVDGSVTRGALAERNDVIDASDGSTTVSGQGSSGWSDDFEIDGDLTDWSATADAQYYTLRLDGEELDPAQFDTSRTLKIEMAEDAPRVDYEFTVDGSVSKGDLAELNDVVRTGSGTTTVSGQASGGWSDDFVIDGDLTDWSATRGSRLYTLTVDGDEIDPAQY